jgi:NhaP-type Na+/H+ or K+/H+ antiporter
MDWHVLRKLIPSAMLLAIPGVILNTLLTGCFVRLAVRLEDEAPSWEESCLLGSILSATDPVAVVSALAALGAPKKLSTLVEGESLLNDGSAVVLAIVFLDWSSKPNDGKNCSGSPPEAGCVIRYFIQVAGGGALIGLVVAIIMYYWIKSDRLRNFPILELAIVFTAIYGTFFVAEGMKTSGVLAVVTLGFCVSAGISKRMSHDGRHNHHVILCQVGYFCNQVAFFAAGIVSVRFMYRGSETCDHTATSGRAWAELVGLYACIHVTRGITILCFWPFLKGMGYGINWKEACIMVYGGLRGAVGLIMGLIVEHNHYINPATAQMVAFHTSGIVLLTLFINGSTIDGLYRKLELYPMNQYRTTHLRKVLYKLESECQKAGIKTICHDWFFHDCTFKRIMRCVPNFCHIKFDAAGVPVPENIEPVKTTLMSLATDANTTVFQIDRLQSKDKEKTFINQWRLHKGKTEQVIVDLMQSSSGVAEQKDHLLHVHNTGDRLFEYRPPEYNANAGFYVSSRPFKDLMLVEHKESSDENIIVKVVKVDKVTLVVGLTHDENEVQNVRHLETQVLGITLENSIAFNCSTCCLNYNGPLGIGELPTGRGALLPGDEVCIQIDKRRKEYPEIIFTVISKSEEPTTVSCAFGAFGAEDLYPILEFRHEDGSRMKGTDLHMS